MKIYCTVEEFGQIVRGCARASCYQCALHDVCNADEFQEGVPKIEQFVRADTIIRNSYVTRSAAEVPEVNADG